MRIKRNLGIDLPHLSFHPLYQKDGERHTKQISLIARTTCSGRLSVFQTRNPSLKLYTSRVPAGMLSLQLEPEGDLRVDIMNLVHVNGRCDSCA